MSNKLSNQNGDRVQIPAGSVFAEFMVGKPFGYYYVFGDDLVEGMPTDAGGWWFVWYVPSGIWAWLHTSNRVWHAEFTNDVLSPWREVAFCIPPQEYSLPLAEGWAENQPCRYCKTQEGMVTVTLAAHRAQNDPIPTSMLVATLPAGYRPAHAMVVPCIVDGMGAVTGHITVGADGAIYVQTGSTSGIYATAQISYISGG